MKRRDFIKVTGIGVAGAATMAAPAIAQSMPEIKWRMPTSWPKSLDTLYGGAEMMAKVVAEATDNKFQIQTFAGGEIVPGLQVLDAVQNGTVEIGHTASYYYFGKDPTFTFGSSVPFGPNMRINQAWYMLGGGKELLNEFYKKYNVDLAARRQHRLPDGRLVPQGDQHASTTSRVSNSASAALPGACCRSSAWCRSRSPAATSIRRSRRARSTPPNGSVPTTTRSSASTRSRRTTTIPAGGKAARCCCPSSISTNGMRCRNTTRAFSSRPVTTPTTG